MYTLVQLARKKTVLALVFALLFGLALAPAGNVHADDDEGDVFGLREITADPEDGGLAIGTDKTLQQTFSGIVNGLLGFLGIVVVGLIIFNGAKWMLANGNEDAIAEAKKGLTAAFIGLALLLSAFAIARFFIGTLSDATGVRGDTVF